MKTKSKTYSLEEKELQMCRLHLWAIKHHEITIHNLVANIAASRLGIKSDTPIKYDLTKGELYVEEK